jgi:hypothetical protein
MSRRKLIPTRKYPRINGKNLSTDERIRRKSIDEATYESLLGSNDDDDEDDDRRDTVRCLVSLTEL